MNERLTARIVLLNENNEIFLLQILPNTIVIDPHNPRLAVPFWITPGGGVEEGEDLLAAARRELFEETGITDAAFEQSPIFYDERPLILRGTLTLFKEHFFLARVNSVVISHEHFNEEEKSMAAGSQWWSLDNLRTITEPLYPQNLCAVMDSMVLSIQ